MNPMARTVAAIVLIAPIAGTASMLPLRGWFGDAPRIVDQAEAKDSLYKRLGGYDAIAAFSDDFIGRLLKDPTFERFFVGFSDDSKKRIRQHLVDFLCQNTGGPCYYTGRDMKTAHAGMHVTKEEWDKAVALIGETLTALKVPAGESQELASMLVPLEKDIVEAE
jgi:hemoglobin